MSQLLQLMILDGLIIDMVGTGFVVQLLKFNSVEEGRGCGPATECE